MYNFTVWLSAAIMILGTLWYCWLIARDEARPPLSAFIILCLVFSLSLFMYAQKTAWSFSANIGLTAATLSTWMVLLSMTITYALKKKLHTEFNPFQRKILYAAIATLILWFVTDNHFLSYILLQIIAVIGYFPIIVRNWKPKEDKESLVLWSSIFFSTLVACYAAWERNDVEAWIYIGRAIPCVGVVITEVTLNRIKFNHLKTTRV